MQGDKCCLWETTILSGDFTVKQEHDIPRPLTVIPADLAKLPVDVHSGWGEMLRRAKLKCSSEIISLYSLYLSLKDCSEKLGCVAYAVLCSSLVFQGDPF